MVKNLPAMQETGVQSLGQEAMEKAMTTHSSILAWRILWTEEPGYIYTMHVFYMGKTFLCMYIINIYIYTHTQNPALKSKEF